MRRWGRGADGDIAGGTIVAISIISGDVVVGGGVLALAGDVIVAGGLRALATMSRHGALPA